MLLTIRLFIYSIPSKEMSILNYISVINNVVSEFECVCMMRVCVYVCARMIV